RHHPRPFPFRALGRPDGPLERRVVVEPALARVRARPGRERQYVARRSLPRRLPLDLPFERVDPSPQGHPVIPLGVLWSAASSAAIRSSSSASSTPRSATATSPRSSP